MAARSMNHLPDLSLRSPTNALYAGYFFGTCAVGLGLLASFAPSMMADLFGLPIPNISSESHKPYIQAKGVRDLALGLAYFVLGAQRNVEGLGALMVCHGLVGLGDAIVVWKKGIRTTVIGHIIGGAFAVGVGAKVLDLY